MQVRTLLEGSTTDEILEHWDTLLPDKMQEWQLDRDEMVKMFGDVRDQWMQQDMEGWLAPNRIYDGVDTALQHALESDSCEVYIVTTKQVRSCDTRCTRAYAHGAVPRPVSSMLGAVRLACSMRRPQKFCILRLCMGAAWTGVH